MFVYQPIIYEIRHGRSGFTPMEIACHKHQAYKPMHKQLAGRHETETKNRDLTTTVE